MTAASPALVTAPARWLWRRLPGWEEWLTFGLAFLTFASVAWSIQHARWADIMPNLMLLGLGGLLAGLLLARLPLPSAAALAGGLVLCLLSTFLQALFLVRGEGLMEKVDVLYVRFQTFFEIAFGQGISNDVLPFAVLVAGLTWAGAFLFAYCLFRWSLAWPGLFMGGLTLFVNFVVLNRGVLAAFLLYAVAGLLLLARANLARHQALWRQEGVPYPSLMGLSVLHVTFWAILVVLMVAWVVPTNYGRPLGAVWGVVAAPFQDLAQDWSRLVGPLRGGRLLPSAELGDFLPLRGRFPLPLHGELATVRPMPGQDPGIIILRGAIYDQYTTGGWRSDESVQMDWPFDAPSSPQGLRQQARGNLRVNPVIVQVQMESGSPLSSLMLVPGWPLPLGIITSGFDVQVQVPERAVVRVDLGSSPSSGDADTQQARVAVDAALRELGTQAPSDEALSHALQGQGYVLVKTERASGNRLRRVEVASVRSVMDSATFVPSHRLEPGQSYWVAGLLPAASAESLRAASANYPEWIRDTYLSLPPDVPRRVRQLAAQITASAATPYDKVAAVEEFIKNFPVDSTVGPPPPGRDPVDYFLFDARRGSPEFHASAMVVLLRAVGVPARLVVGVALTQNDFDPEQGVYHISARNAYLWPEVYFPNSGWLPFSPVPRGHLPFNFPYQQSFQPPVFGGIPTEPGPDPFGIEGVLPFEEMPVLEPPPPVEMPSSTDWSWVWMLLAALGGAALVIGAARLAWELPLGRLPYAMRVWEKTVRLANLAALGPRPGETPREFVGRLHRRLYLRDLALVAEVYGRARYGGMSPSKDEEERLKQLWPRLRSALAREILRRPWRRAAE